MQPIQVFLLLLHFQSALGLLTNEKETPRSWNG